jgi:hypothetical protein
MLKHILGRALESQRMKGDCREAMKTKVKICFSAAHSNLTMLQSNTNIAQMVWSIVLALQLKHSSATPINHNNTKFGLAEFIKMLSITAMLPLKQSNFAQNRLKMLEHISCAVQQPPLPGA